MSLPSHALRALAVTVETVLPELSPVAQAAVSIAMAQVHAAADAEAAAEAQRGGGGPTAGGLLAVFATTIVDGFFTLAGAQHAATATTRGAG